MLEKDYVFISSHFTRFAKELRDNISGLETRTVDKISTAYFTLTADDLIYQSLKNPSTIAQSMIEVVVFIRSKMKLVDNKFIGLFDHNSQKASVPTELLS